MFWRRRLRLYTDGAIGDGTGGTGLGALIRDEADRVLRLANAVAGPMTCNEAEYAALLLGLGEALRLRPTHLDVFMDSQVVVAQMTGRADVASPRLQRWHAQATRLVRQVGAVSFHHVAREENGLADALAVEALRKAGGAGGRAGKPTLQGGQGGKPTLQDGRAGKPTLQGGQGGKPALEGGRAGKPAPRGGQGGEPAPQGGRAGKPTPRDGQGGKPAPRAGGADRRARKIAPLKRRGGHDGRQGVSHRRGGGGR